jgi:hAT family C-terminal dimerisation region
MVAPAFNRLWNMLEKLAPKVSKVKFEGVLESCGKLGNARRNWYKDHQYWEEFDTHLESPAEESEDVSDGTNLISQGEFSEQTDEECNDDEYLCNYQANDWEDDDRTTFRTPLGVDTVSLKDLSLSERIGVMARLGLLLLRKHYNRSSDATVVALALDPRYGFDYLRKSSWSQSIEDYVEPAIQKSITQYKAFFPDVPNNEPVTQQAQTKQDQHKFTCNKRSKHAEVSHKFGRNQYNQSVKYNSYDTYMDSDSDEELETSDKKKNEKVDELVRYKNLTPIDKHVYVLQWWYDRRDSFPILSSIFLDHATIPATSISPEQLFSSMGLLCTASRNRMNHDTITKLTCLKNWYGVL